MKRENFITLILSTVGGLLFALGMCMTMVREGLMIWGITVGVVGIVLLLCLIPLCAGGIGKASIEAGRELGRTIVDAGKNAEKR